MDEDQTERLLESLAGLQLRLDTTNERLQATNDRLRIVDNTLETVSHKLAELLQRNYGK